MELLSGGLRKVSGNLAGVSGLGGVDFKSPIFAKTGFLDALSTGRNKTENLQYPLNVESDPSQGHHILFEIMQQDPAKLAAARAVKGASELVSNLKSETGTSEPIAGITSGELFGNLQSASKTGWDKYKARAVSKGQRGEYNSMLVRSEATTKMNTCIALYMPPSVQVSYGAKYGETEIGIGSEAIAAGIRAFMEEGGGMQGTAAGVGTGLAGIFNLGQGQKLLQQGLGKIPGLQGSEAVFAINRGSIITPRMELMFEGMQRRDFTFAFNFIPKSEQEAEVVKKIVHKFKYHMSSNYGTGGMGGVDGVREMEIPDFFQIKYMHHGKINTHLNLIKQCVLTKTDVEYGADRYKAYADGRPQNTKLTLSFQELEIITKDYVANGY